MNSVAVGSLLSHIRLFPLLHFQRILYVEYKKLHANWNSWGNPLSINRRVWFYNKLGVYDGLYPAVPFNETYRTEDNQKGT